MENSDHRAAFAAATIGFVGLVRTIQPEQWTWPGLGVWDVRALVGHASRALSTIEMYLGLPFRSPAISSPVEYFAAVLSDATDADARQRQDAAIAERGRQAGYELGDDPARAVASLATRVAALVEATPNDALLSTPAGTISLINYLPTRTFELAVHSLDLARALHLQPPATLTHAIGAACELAGHLAGRHHNAAGILLFLTGRDVPEGPLSVL
ncbi:MAG: mycothiol maleylpyruvate isomerase [Actinomycetota bacterium]|nr:MAG: mycothiol maleylpyruvate isomerase [Actinomycetota bacterium]